MSRVIPIHFFGRLYGLTGIAISAGSILGSFMLAPILHATEFPMNYGILFIIAGVFFVLSSLSCLFMREKTPKQIAGRVSESFIVYLRGLKPLITQKIVIVYAIFTGFILINQLPSVFFYSYLHNQLHIPVNPTTITLLAFASQAVLLPVLGVCLDKYGRMRTIAAYVFLTMLSLLVLLFQLSWGYYLAFILYGMYGLFIPMIKARLSNECVSASERMDTVIIINIASVSLSAFFSLIYGLIAQWSGTYSPLFILTLLVMIGFFRVAWSFYKLLNHRENHV
jgi:MFS family permease